MIAPLHCLLGNPCFIHSEQIIYICISAMEVTGLPKDLNNLIAAYSYEPRDIQTEQNHDYFAGTLDLRLKKLCSIYVDLSRRYHQYTIPGLRRYIAQIYDENLLMVQGIMSDIAVYQNHPEKFIKSRIAIYGSWHMILPPPLEYIKQRNAGRALSDEDREALLAAMDDIVSWLNNIMSVVNRTHIKCIGKICGDVMKGRLVEFANKWRNRHIKEMRKISPPDYI